MTTKQLFLSIVFCLLSSTLSFSQTDNKMRLANNVIVYHGVQITIPQAKRIAKEHSTEAYEYFRKANKINGWNYVWSFAGGYELGAGTFQFVFLNNKLGLANMAIGGILISIPFHKRRRERQLMYVKEAIKHYNRAIM